MTENEISKYTLDYCIKIHRTLGPGLLESAYEDCLMYEFRKAGILCESQVKIPLIYEGMCLGDGFKADIVVEDKVIIELKALQVLDSIHYAQLKTYLKLSGIKLGLLVNFGEKRLVDGFHRIVNGL